MPRADSRNCESIGEATDHFPREKSELGIVDKNEKRGEIRIFAGNERYRVMQNSACSFDVDPLGDSTSQDPNQPKLSVFCLLGESHAI